MINYDKSEPTSCS